MAASHLSGHISGSRRGELEEEVEAQPEGPDSSLGKKFYYFWFDSSPQWGRDWLLTHSHSVEGSSLRALLQLVWAVNLCARVGGHDAWQHAIAAPSGSAGAAGVERQRCGFASAASLQQWQGNHRGRGGRR